MMNQESNDSSSNSSGVGLLGDYLKQKRNEKNYTLEKLSQKTKISVNILKSLEANDYEHLPSAAYIKGFVTSYVKVLGLPLDEAINKMEYTYLNVLGKPFPALNHTKNMTQSRREPVPTDIETSSPHDVIENSDSIIENTKSMLPIIIFGAVIILFVGGYKLISTVVENEVNASRAKDLGPKMESSAALVNPGARKPEATKEVPVYVPQGKEEPVTPAAATATSTPEAPAAVVEKQPEVELPRNYPIVEFKKIRDRLYTVQTDAPENNDPNLLRDKARIAMNPELQNIYIHAISGNTWVSYKIDERPIESVIISKGSDLLLQGNEIRLFLGNVNVTKIFYNNYLIDAPTKTGVKSLIFPEESNSKYLLPLFPKAKDDILYTAEEYMKRMKLEEDERAKRQR
jgi:cytoskeleton protein RodZ